MTVADDDALSVDRPGVRDVPEDNREASVLCSAEHGDGRRWRVAVLQRDPRRLVTDDENLPWPDTSAPVLASCRTCWRVLCDVCRAEGQSEGYCGHTRRGEWVLDVAKMKHLLGRSRRDMTVSEVLWTPSVGEVGP